MDLKSFYKNVKNRISNLKNLPLSQILVAGVFQRKSIWNPIKVYYFPYYY